MKKKQQLRNEQFCSRDTFASFMLPKVVCHDLNTGLFFSFFSPSSCDSCCTITRVPLWFVPKPQVKIKLSKSSEFDLPVQLWAEKLLCQAWLAIKTFVANSQKKNDHLKVNFEVLSFLPKNCSVALPPQGHLRSRLGSPREMRFHSPVQELRLWKVRITHSCPREALKLCSISSSPGITGVCGGLLILQSRWQARKPQKTAIFSIFPFPEAGLVSFPLDFQENKS